MTTPAGWYPDPYDPAMLRYWDGETWTESVSPAATPTQPPGAPPGAPPQPSPPQAWAQHGAAHGGHGYGYGDVGSWFSETFSRLVERIVPMAVLLFAIPVAGYAIAVGLASIWLSDLTIDRTGDVEVTGFRAGLALVIGLVLLATFVVHGVCWLAANHQMYAAHTGRPQPLGVSLSTGVRRLPRAIGWWLVFVLAVVAVMGLLFAGPVVLIAAGDGGGGGVGLIVLLFLVLVVFMIWIGIRLAFWGTAVAVGPPGTNPFSASWNATRDKWWGTLGRLLLIGLILWLVSLVFNVVTNAIGGALFADVLEFDAVSGDVLLDGRPIDQVDVINVGDLLPSVGSFIVLAVLYLLGQAINQAVNVSAVTSLYARADGPGEV